MTLHEFFAPLPRCALATESDNGELLSLTRATVMKLRHLTLRYDRGTDYFAAAREAGVAHFSGVFRNEDRSIQGTATLSVRNARLEGKVARIGYFGDLRLARQAERKTRLEWLLFFDRALRLASTVDGVGPLDFYLTAVLRSNLPAMRLLLNRVPGLVYRELEPYAGVQVLGRFLPLHSRPTYGRIRRAQASDLLLLRQFLSNRQKNRWLGEWITPQGGDELDRRLQTWDSFGVENFWLSFDPAGKLVACVAPRQTPAKKMVPGQFSNAFRILAGLQRFAGLAPLTEGAPLNTFYLTHFEVDESLPLSEQQRLRRELVDRVFQTARCAGDIHSLSWIEYPRFPATQVPLRGYLVQRTPGALYQVVPREHAENPDHDLSVRKDPRQTAAFDISIA